MRMKLLAATGLLIATAGPAFAQLAPGAAERLVPPPAAGAPAAGGVNEVLGSGALPGVGMQTTTTTERGGPSGVGGLSGGVGQAGTPVPGTMSGAPSATAPLRGIPFETTPGQPTTVSPN